MGFFEKLKAGLAKTKNAVFGRLDGLFKAFSKVDEELLEELEEILITADVGVETTEEILDTLRERIRDGRIKQPDDVRAALRDVMNTRLGRQDFKEERIDDHLSAMSVELTNLLNGEGPSARDPAFRNYGLRVKQTDILSVCFYANRR